MFLPIALEFNPLFYVATKPATTTAFVSSGEPARALLHFAQRDHKAE